MANETGKPQGNPNVAVNFSGAASARAPMIYFEKAPFFGYGNGIGKLALEATRHIGYEPGGGVLVERTLVAHLIGNIEAIKNLRSALDKILLLADPKPEGPTN